MMTNHSQYVDDAMQLLRGMVAIPSISREEREVSDFLYQSLTNLGLPVRRIGCNLWCQPAHFDSSRPTILLNSHIDTVKPAPGWTEQPFTPHEAEGCLYGLGTNDAGASVVSLIQVFRLLADTSQSYNLMFLASCEEEVSGKNGIEMVLPQLPPIALAIVGEPTGMQPAVSERGLMVIDGTAHGKSGHAARNEGINAIYRALPDLAWLSTHQFEKVSPLMGPVKMTVTQVNAGTQHNVVPDVCTFVIDVRSNDCYTNHELFAEIDSHTTSEMKARSFRLQPSHIDLDHPIVQRATGLGLEPFASPTMSDQALMPFTSIKIGPGQSSRSHSANEFIRVDEIAQAIDLYVQLLDGLQI